MKSKIDAVNEKHKRDAIDAKDIRDDKFIQEERTAVSESDILNDKRTQEDRDARDARDARDDKYIKEERENRGNSKDGKNFIAIDRRSYRSKNIGDLLKQNLLWIITTLLAIGGFVATIKYQGVGITTNTAKIELDHERIIDVEKSIVKFERMEGDIQEIKYDIKEIKNILYKPVITQQNTPSNTISSSNIAMNTPIIKKN